MKTCDYLICSSEMTCSNHGTNTYENMRLIHECDLYSSKYGTFISCCILPILPLNVIKICTDNHMHHYHADKNAK